ncbi:MAG: hypothetical protein KID04_16355 [Clostridium sp.]|nr:hypothetical protein [Clostridium sp.]
MADIDGLSGVKFESIYGAAVNDYDSLKKQVGHFIRLAFLMRQNNEMFFHFCQLLCNNKRMAFHYKKVPKHSTKRQPILWIGGYKQ